MHQLPPYKPEGFGLERTLEIIPFCDVAEVWDDLADGLKHPNRPLDQPPHPGARREIPSLCWPWWGGGARRPLLASPPRVLGGSELHSQTRVKR